MSRHGALATTLTLFVALLVSMTTTATATATSAQAGQSARASANFVPMRFGDRSWRVRILQSRLHQLRLHSEVVHSRFDEETRKGVRAFKKDHGLRVSGLVTKATWKALVAVTETPTYDALHNIYQPGPPLLKRGDRGLPVRRLQARLKQIDWYPHRVTGRYRARTVKAVRGFQAKREIPVTGKVDRRTLRRLYEMTRKPTRAELFNLVTNGPPLDRRCETGRAMCVDKSSRTLRWVVNGAVRKTMDVRFGSDELPTREGAFEVYWKSRDHVSSLYNTSMPFAMFFSGGQAVHYSPDFAANGYNGASHGCVNVRDREGIEWLFDRVRIGDKVIVYRS